MKSKKTYRQLRLTNIYTWSWWSVLLTGTILYVLGTWILPNTSFSNPLSMAFSGAIQAVTLPVSIILVAIALMLFAKSLFTRGRRSRLFDTQTGIESIRDLTWDDFERLTAEYYFRKGYKIVENQQKGADGGVDIRLFKDGKTILVQCKHWANKVGVSVIREHLGTVCSESADGGIVVTSGEFTQSAMNYAQQNNIDLIDGAELARLHRSQHTESVTPIKESSGVRSCPLCGANMIKRTARKGSSAGRTFYGCVNFPDCRATRSDI